MMIRTVIAALPLVLVLSGCGSSVTAPEEAETTTEVSFSGLTPVTDPVKADSSSRTGGTMGSGN